MTNKNLQILIAEDSEFTKLLIEETLKEEQCSFEIVDNGFEVMDRIREKQFDLVLLDIEMPGMDGFDTATRIRNINDPAKSNVPLIALTSHKKDKIHEQLDKSGFNTHIHKPFKKNELLNVINDYPWLNPGKHVSKHEPGRKLYDLTNLNEFTNNDSSMLKELIHIFVETSAVFLKNAKALYKNKQWEKLGKEAHSFGSQVEMIGASDELTEEMEKLEYYSLEKKNTNEIGIIIDNIDERISRIIKEIKKDFSI